MSIGGKVVAAKVAFGVIKGDRTDAAFRDVKPPNWVADRSLQFRNCDTYAQKKRIH
jgi:hypothetical protein